MSKYIPEVYNISSDTDSTAYIQQDQEESSTDDDEYIINKNNKSDVFLNFSLELEPFYFNNLSVNTNLIIPIFLNATYALIKKYNMECCHFTRNNYYHYILTPLIADTSTLSDLLEEQYNNIK